MYIRIDQPIRIANRTIFVAMISTYRLLNGSHWTPTVMINPNLGEYIYSYILFIYF
jgi:hypothetical protein